MERWRNEKTDAGCAESKLEFFLRRTALTLDK
jgi:hypothetical protein